MRWLLLLLAGTALLSACREGEDDRVAADNVAPGDTSDTDAYAGIRTSEEVRFTGTAPFWSGRVNGNALTYSTPETGPGETVPVTRFAGRGGLSWSGQYRGRPLRLAVTESACSDGMSDRRYPFAATLLVNGEQRNGCAWTARRSFKEASTAIEPKAAAIAARGLVLAEWRRAANRAGCAPIGFAMALDGTPRRANFSGGWAVAWDLPGERSAFGVAGTGSLAGDEIEAPAQRGRLAEQWPLFRELPALPQPAFAGYGVEGAGSYPSENPQGTGLISLAYVRVGGQSCDYNVWSRLGKAHLEELLDSLRVIPSP